MSMESLYDEMRACNACKMRAGCTQVVTSVGQVNSPTLMIIGESPGEEEDESGEPFVGASGQALRAVLRGGKTLNRTNTLISNVLRCRPPRNKFPSDDSADICVSKWLTREIAEANPKRLLLLGNVPLKYVAGLKGITTHRGRWIEAMGVRTMPTYHPSYILRMDSNGDVQAREQWEADISEVAAEVGRLLGMNA